MPPSGQSDRRHFCVLVSTCISNKTCARKAFNAHWQELRHRRGPQRLEQEQRHRPVPQWREQELRRCRDLQWRGQELRRHPDPQWRGQEQKTLTAPPACLVLPQNTKLERVKMAWAELQRAWETLLWQTKTQDYLLQPSGQRAWDPPPSRPKSRKVLRADVSCGGRSTSALLPDLGVQPGEQAENGTPSVPAVIVEPSDHCSLACRLRGPILAETFCHGLCSGGPRDADRQAA
ncbi:hypothetical protein AMECASPLE_014394 [Ameca splendens]|uniref:Uncharacterized protein n=1 Tax=Ameca splendens TaxID=208324 RepID=A0ABV0ZBD9_9TELE